jgi:hypothetical protein
VAAPLPSAFRSTPELWTLNALVSGQVVPAGGLLSVMNADPSYVLAKDPKRLYPNSRKWDESPSFG